MHRIKLADDAGWFDLDAAQSWDEDTFTDPSGNTVSCATRSKFLHERLYRTRKGNWILNVWLSDFPDRERYVRVSDSCALAWLITNSEEIPSYLEATAAGLEV